MGALEKWDAEYEGAKPPENDYDELPDGKYQAYIEKLELLQSKKGDPMLKFTLRIAAGGYANRCLFRHSVINGNTIEFIKKDLGILGHAGKLSDLETVEGRIKLVNILVEVTQKTKGHDEKGRPNTNVYFNRRCEGAAKPLASHDEPPF